MSIAPDLLNKFCGQNDVRTYINEPFSYNGKVYATNAHIMVRVDPDAIADKKSYPLAQEFSPGQSKFKNMGENADHIFDCNPVHELVAVPEWDHIVPEVENCDACDGDGFEWAIEHGSRNDIKIECRHCEGSGGESPKARPIKIGAAHIDARYLALVESLPNPRISLSEDPMRAIPFVFDGGVGLVMPMRV